MYTHKNFKSKAELKRAIVAGEKITYYFQPGPFGGNEYASAIAKDGVIVSVK